MYTLDLMFVLRRLFLALFHVEAQGAVQLSEAMEAAWCIVGGLNAAVVIHECTTGVSVRTRVHRRGHGPKCEGKRCGVWLCVVLTIRIM